MFLEVDFQDGTVGRYPCSPGGTVTIQEPNQLDAAGVQGPGPRYSFALTDVVGVTLRTDPLSPEPAQETTVVQAPEAAAPAEAPAAPAEPVSEGAPPVEAPPAPVASSVAEAVAVSDTPGPVVQAAQDAVAAVATRETPEQQLEHAQALQADLQAAIEKFPDAVELQDALTLTGSLIADLTPDGSGS